LPKDSPTGDSTITIAALNAQPIDIRLDSGKKNPLLEYAAHLDDMDSGKTYQFDPRVMASENRLDFAIMVLDPSREQPILAAPTPIHAASPAIGSAAAASPGSPAAHAPAAVPASAPAVTAPAAKAAAPAAPPPGVPQSSSPVAAPPPASKPAAAGK
jgi:translation initiation factor IF-2